ncbi:MAG TPA: NUDIX domain-containing protein [Chloroflexia bacterium]|nr:NUDIX domain-containing protein [Chloroflexia bacterium]
MPPGPKIPIRYRKAIAYITREVEGRQQLLVFTHRDNPEAGVQVPAGTAHEGEDIEATLFREVEEETGLAGLHLKWKLAQYDYRHPITGNIHERHVFHMLAPNDTPDHWTWVETSGGEVPDDEGYVFEFAWRDLAEEIYLAGDQGDCLHMLRDEYWATSGIERAGKVVAYITREVAGRKQLLVYVVPAYPHLGAQVPGGGVEPGEAVEEAVLREIREETGLTGLKIVRRIATYDYYNAYTHKMNERHVFHIAAPTGTPDSWTWVEPLQAPYTDPDEFIFEYSWVDLDEGVRLSRGLGDWLHSLHTE